MTDENGLLVDEHLFDDEAYDPLALEDVQGVGRATEPRQKHGQRLGQTQIRRAVAGLRSDRVELTPQRLVPLTQAWHPVA